MARGQIELRMYEVRCHPCSKAGVPVPNETGNSIRTERIAAASQAIAEQMAASRNRGWIVVETLRLDGVPVPKVPRKPRQRKTNLAALGLVTAASLQRKDPS